MTTVDANGIIRYQETDAVTPLQAVLNAGLQSASDALTPARNGSIKYTANTTTRAALATSFGPTASKPLYVWRGNAAAGRNLEVTINGTAWQTISTSADDSGWVPLGLSSPATGTCFYRVFAGTVSMYYDISATISGDTQLTVPLPSQYFPPGSLWVSNAYIDPATARSMSTVYVAGTSGVLRASSGGGTAITRIRGNAMWPLSA